MQSLESQFYAFIVTVLIGIITGISFDVYRVTKGLIRPRKFFVYLGDLLFWIVATLMVFFMLLIGNWGEFRFYVLVGAVVGSLFYFKLFSRLVIRTLVNLISLIKKVLTCLLRVLKFTCFVITYPMVVLKNIIIIPVGLLGRACTRAGAGTARFTERMITGPLKRKTRHAKNGIRQKLRAVFGKKE